MVLTFDAALVRRLLEHSRQCTKWKKTYGQRVGKPGLWLVGDSGVYLMSNGDPGLVPAAADLAAYPQNKHNVCAYADQCDPHKMEFDEWWENKGDSFGSSDGVEFLAARSVQIGLAGTSPLTAKWLAQGKKLTVAPMVKRWSLDVTPGRIRFVGPMIKNKPASLGKELH